jgi:hypothetical protein
MAQGLYNHRTASEEEDDQDNQLDGDENDNSESVESSFGNEEK